MAVVAALDRVFSVRSNACRAEEKPKSCIWMKVTALMEGLFPEYKLLRFACVNS